MRKGWRNSPIDTSLLSNTRRPSTSMRFLPDMTECVRTTVCSLLPKKQNLNVTRFLDDCEATPRPSEHHVGTTPRRRRHSHGSSPVAKSGCTRGHTLMRLPTSSMSKDSALPSPDSASSDMVRG